MRIYLAEVLYPTFNQDNLVLWEQGIELGDWKEDRKKTIEVPISEVSLLVTSTDSAGGAEQRNALRAHFSIAKWGAASSQRS